MVPAYPTMREMAGDAFDELVGYDGRVLHTPTRRLHANYTSNR